MTRPRLREFSKELRRNEVYYALAGGFVPAFNHEPTIYAIGLDYGTNSVRALIVDTADGREIATAVWNYEHGDAGVILSRDPNLARQHPADYIKGAEITMRKAAGRARHRIVKRIQAGQIVGIGVDTTGSTPLPVDGQGQPLAFDRRFATNPNGHGLVVERPYRHGGSGGNHRTGQENSTAIPGQMRRHLFQRMVFQQNPPLPAHQPGSF